MTSPRLTLRHMAAPTLLVLALAGCASVTPQENLASSQEAISPLFAGTEVPSVQLAQTDETRTQLTHEASVLLQKPLSQADAMRLSLANSPAFQALIAASWRDASEAANSGRIPNPIFSFERMAIGDEREITRTLSFGVMDLLLWPLRNQQADQRIEQTRLKLAGDMVEQLTNVRTAWVAAVAATEQLNYAQMLMKNGELTAELARRMKEAGNFNRLDHLRQQSFYADAATNLAQAQAREAQTRETLTRSLGLDASQRENLQLPTRLPDLPDSPVLEATVLASVSDQRLDIRLARATWLANASASQRAAFDSYIDVELGLKNTNISDRASGESIRGKGFEADVSLPLFNWGGAARDAAEADTLSAQYSLEQVIRDAASDARQSYMSYRIAYDLARHYRDEIIPLQQAIAEENVLRYNGMLIGVFELLANHREQTSSVMAAIAQQENFWIADARLQASMLGRPVMGELMPAQTSKSNNAGDGGH